MITTMKQARARYKEEHGEFTTCLSCGGEGGILNTPPKDLANDETFMRRWKPVVRCCAGGAVIHYPNSAPGFRRWARSTFQPHQTHGKLLAILTVAP